MGSDSSQVKRIARTFSSMVFLRKGHMVVHTGWRFSMDLPKSGMPMWKPLPALTSRTSSTKRDPGTSLRKEIEPMRVVSTPAARSSAKETESDVVTLSRRSSSVAWTLESASRKVTVAVMRGGASGMILKVKRSQRAGSASPGGKALRTSARRRAGSRAWRALANTAFPAW